MGWRVTDYWAKNTTGPPGVWQGLGTQTQLIKYFSPMCVYISSLVPIYMWNLLIIPESFSVYNSQYTLCANKINKHVYQRCIIININNPKTWSPGTSQRKTYKLHSGWHKYTTNKQRNSNNYTSVYIQNDDIPLVVIVPGSSHWARVNRTGRGLNTRHSTLLESVSLLLEA